VLEPSALDHIQEYYLDEIIEIMESGVKLWEGNAEAPFILLIAEKPAPQMMVIWSCGENRFVGALESEDVLANAWAKRTFHNYINKSNPISEKMFARA
jgi:hypothetical protein